MPPKKRRQRSGQQVQTAAAQAKARDQETIRQINQAVADGQDVSQLRKLAAVRGLVNADLRARLWPCLLAGQGASPALVLSPGAGIAGSGAYHGQNTGAAGHSSRSHVSNPSAAHDGSAPASLQQYHQWADGKHKDNNTVKVDVERSLYSFASFLSEEERDTKRQELQRLLNAVVVSAEEGAVHYYQGLHDVASVLLLTAGELPAFEMLRKLATGHLRDATRPSLDPVIELLGLMEPIVEAADVELAQFIHKQGLPPFYALSWFITWFSHDLKEFAEVCRLFDLFLATHPLMPLYVGAAAMRTQRQQLLAADEMPVLHSKLVNMSITKRATADQLAVQAIELYKRAPPQQLIASRSLSLQQCVAPRVQLRSGVWQYPEPRVTGPGVWSQQKLQALVQSVIRLPLPGTPAQRKKLVVASLTGVLGSLYVVMCMLMTRNGENGSGSPFSILYKF